MIFNHNNSHKEEQQQCHEEMEPVRWEWGQRWDEAQATAAAEASQDLLAAPDSVLAEVAEAEEVGMADGTCSTLLA